MATQNFRVIFEPEKEGGYHAYCPTLRGCHSYGETLDEAKKNIAEAIEAYLESLAKHGEEIPKLTREWLSQSTLAKQSKKAPLRESFVIWKSLPPTLSKS